MGTTTKKPEFDLKHLDTYVAGRLCALDALTLQNPDSGCRAIWAGKRKELEDLAECFFTREQIDAMTLLVEIGDNNRERPKGETDAQAIDQPHANGEDAGSDTANREDRPKPKGGQVEGV